MQTEFTPLLALQDAQVEQRHLTHDSLLAQIEATREGDVMKVREVVRASVRSSVRWLGGLRTELQGDSASEQLRATLERYRGQSGTASFTGEAA